MAEEFEELNADAQQTKPLSIPAKLTPEMIAAHEVTHLPFRSWCSHCVRGRGKSFQHRKAQHDQDDEAHPVVSLDYRHSLGLQVNLSRSRSAVQKCRCLIRFLGYACTVDFEVRSRTCHFGTDKRCEEHTICKRCYMSVGELAKRRCTWHVKW